MYGDICWGHKETARPKIENCRLIFSALAWIELRRRLALNRFQEAGGNWNSPKVGSGEKKEVGVDDSIAAAFAVA